MIESTFLLGLVLAALAFFFIWDDTNPRFFNFGRPLMAGTVAGFVVGDLTLGLAVGATLELLALGVDTFGGATVPDYLSGAVVGTALGALADLEVGAAITLAVPIALLLTQLDVLARMGNVFWLHRADAYAREADLDKIGLMNIMGTLFWGLSRAVPVFLGVWLGSDLVESAVEASPEWLIDGLSTAGGLLPALGIALLLRLLPLGRFWPFLIVGFAAAAYLEVGLVGVALIGVALAALMVKYARMEEEVA